jgi:prepilin-type N-terminal cleavage/methylation domain-containing protein
MITKLSKKMRGEGGFNMIELMVVVVIVGILAAIAVPIYSKYAKNSRVTEATGKIGDILTAAKSYAVENESNTVVTDANWPATCAATNFVGDCSNTQNFSYALTGINNGLLTITGTGLAGSPMAGVTVTLTITNPTTNGSIVIAGL